MSVLVVDTQLLVRAGDHKDEMGNFEPTSFRGLLTGAKEEVTSFEVFKALVGGYAKCEKGSGMSGDAVVFSIEDFNGVSRELLTLSLTAEGTAAPFYALDISTEPEATVSNAKVFAQSNRDLREENVSGVFAFTKGSPVL